MTQSLLKIFSKEPTHFEYFCEQVSSTFSKPSAWLQENWNKKNASLFLGTIALVAAAWAINKAFKNRPIYPSVTLKSSLHRANLSLKPLKQSKEPINTTLTFCIDTSESMQNEKRLDQIKTAVSKVLENCQALTVSSTAKIAIALIGFDSKASLIADSTHLLTPSLSSTIRPVERLQEKLLALTPKGGTSIIDGLNLAVSTLESAAKSNPLASHSLVLLTDGVSNDGILDKDIKNIHTRLSSVNANLYAVGIGKQHSKSTLQKIANLNGFKGTYIDTTIRNNTIEKAIADIYQQVIPTYTNVRLSTSQLAAGTWSIDNQLSIADNQQSSCKLENLEEQDLLRKIKIHYKKLPQPSFDLSQLKFQLSFTDPNGRKGLLTLPWKPNKIIQQEIVQD